MSQWQDITRPLKEAIANPSTDIALRVATAAASIHHLKFDFPAIYYIIMCFLDDEPSIVLNTLAVWEPSTAGLQSNEKAQAFIRALQKELRVEQ